MIFWCIWKWVLRVKDKFLEVSHLKIFFSQNVWLHQKMKKNIYIYIYESGHGTKQNKRCTFFYQYIYIYIYIFSLTNKSKHTKRHSIWIMKSEWQMKKIQWGELTWEMHKRTKVLSKSSTQSQQKKSLQWNNMHTIKSFEKSKQNEVNQVRAVCAPFDQRGQRTYLGVGSPWGARHPMLGVAIMPH